jgi:hypothetical protein
VDAIRLYDAGKMTGERLAEFEKHERKNGRPVYPRKDEIKVWLEDFKKAHGGGQ